MKLLYFLMCPIMVFSHDIWPHTIPDDCPFIQGLSKKNTNLTFEIRFKGAFGGAAYSVVQFDYSFDFSEGEKYSVRSIYMHKFIITDHSLSKRDGALKYQDTLCNFGGVISPMEEVYPGAMMLWEFYKGKIGTPKRVAFMPHCSRSCSKVDEAFAYYCTADSDARSFMIIGEDFKPGELVTIQYSLGNLSKTFIESFAANSNGRIYKKIYSPDEMSRGGEGKVIIIRSSKNESIEIDFLWGEKYLHQDNLIRNFPIGEQDSLIFSTKNQ